MLRRGMMRGAAAAGLGEYTLVYQATITTGSRDMLTVSHNLGIKPKLILIDIVPGTETVTNYTENGIFAIEPYGTAEGIAFGLWHRNDGVNNGTISRSADTQPKIAADTTTVNIRGAVASNRWDDGATYIVSVYA